MPSRCSPNARVQTLKGGRDNALLAETRLRGPDGDERVVLAFPITYMNQSGQAVGALVRRFRIATAEQIIVVHDELDLSPGELKVKVGGGLAGHNGLRSMKQHLHTQDFIRVRIGVGKPPSGAWQELRTVEGSQTRARTPRRDDRRCRRRGGNDRVRRGRCRDAAIQRQAMTTPLPGTPGTAPTEHSHAPLESLPGLLRDEPGLTRALGDPSARLAVVEVARPISIAALAHLSSRRPLVVACPTGTMAGQLVDDLAQFVPAGDVAMFPRLGDPPIRAGEPKRRDHGTTTRGPVATASWRPSAEDHRRRSSLTAPESWDPGRPRSSRSRSGPVSRSTRRHWPDNSSSSATGVRNWSNIAASSRGGAPSSMCTRQRLMPRSESTCGATKSTDSHASGSTTNVRPTTSPRRRSFQPASSCRPTMCANEAAGLVASEPWGREQWERLAEGAHFDGMESWLPWLIDSDRLPHRRLARRREGTSRRASAHARSSQRPHRRRRRPRSHARRDLGARPRQVVPAAARRPGNVAVQRHSELLVTRLHAGLSRHTGRRSVGLGACGRRRLGSHGSSGPADQQRLPRRSRCRRLRFGRPASLAPPRPGS